MAVSVTLPKMGESVVEGTIIRWLKAEGEWVNEDEPIVEISTDKIDTELPSPASGVLTKILAKQDETVEVGAQIAEIDTDASAGDASNEAAPQTPAPERAETPPAPAAPAAPAASAAPPAPAQAQPQPAASAGDGGSVVLSPLVRKLARERDVDLSRLRGSGPGGRITKDDVLAAGGVGGTTRVESGSNQAARGAAATSVYAVPSGEHEDVAFTRIRSAIAEHMVRSRSTAAHVTSITEVDMTRIAGLRARAKAAFEASEGSGLTFMPFIASATVQALRTFPELNAHLLEDGTTARLWREVNLGIAVGRDEGLIVPVVHGADTMNLEGLARGISDVGARARTKGGLTPDDVTGGTFTITNYGSVGGVMDTPIISQPQVAILGVGAIVKRPAVITVDGADAIAIRHMMFLSLSYDHRWIDGHRAAQFNSRVKQILEDADYEHELGL